MFPFYQNEYFKCQFCQRPKNRTSIFVIYFSFTLWGWGREKIAWVDIYWLSLGSDSAFIRVLPLTTFWEVVHLVMAKFAASPSLATLLYTFPIRQRSIRLATLPILLAHSDVVKLLVKKNGCILKQGCCPWNWWYLFISSHPLRKARDDEFYYGI